MMMSEFQLWWFCSSNLVLIVYSYSLPKVPNHYIDKNLVHFLFFIASPFSSFFCMFLKESSFHTIMASPDLGLLHKDALQALFFRDLCPLCTFSMWGVAWISDVDLFYDLSHAIGPFFVWKQTACVRLHFVSITITSRYEYNLFLWTDWVT